MFNLSWFVLPFLVPSLYFFSRVAHDKATTRDSFSTHSPLRGDKGSSSLLPNSLPVRAPMLLSCIIFGLIFPLCHAIITITPPPATDCLYVSDQNGLVQVVSWMNNGNTSFPTGAFVQTVPQVGYLPTGLAISGNIIYAATDRSIVSFTINNGLTKNGPFVDLAFSGIPCQPAGMVVAEDALWVSCGLGKAESIHLFHTHGYFFRQSLCGHQILLTIQRLRYSNVEAR